mmetsp:Transcript_6280/g.19377  ORF Transcript_6280/g.19377 Transcript_6280/m.19377 type:complete len:204 (+) Transcript_6280:597-1208(+)
MDWPCMCVLRPRRRPSVSANRAASLTQSGTPVLYAWRRPSSSLIFSAHGTRSRSRRTLTRRSCTAVCFLRSRCWFGGIAKRPLGGSSRTSARTDWCRSPRAASMRLDMWNVDTTAGRSTGTAGAPASRRVAAWTAHGRAPSRSQPRSARTFFLCGRSRCQRRLGVAAAVHRLTCHSSSRSRSWTTPSGCRRTHSATFQWTGRR